MVSEKTQQRILDILVTVAVVAMAVMLVSGCLSTHLRKPAREHSIQLDTLCLVAQDQADEKLAAGVCESAKQACLIDAAVRREDGDECR